MPVFTLTGRTPPAKRSPASGRRRTKQVLQAAAASRTHHRHGASRKRARSSRCPHSAAARCQTKDIAIFFRQFSVMIDAGLPLVQCLEILAANQENLTFQKALNGVRTTVEGGSTLANAMRGYPKIFDDLTTNMIEAGETGGILDVILQRLAAYVEKAVKLKAAVKSALIYPVSVISIAVLVVGALLKCVVPIFANLFAGLGVELPLANPHRDGTERVRGQLLVVVHRVRCCAVCSGSSRYARIPRAATCATR